MTTETHGLKFVVDTSEAQRGFRDYKAAVEGIYGSLDKFEAHVAKTMKNVASAANNKAALSSFKSAIASFGSVSVNAGTIKGISALSAALRDFKAPSAGQSANLKTFLGSFKGMPDLTSAYRTIKAIDDINIAMRGFKAPPAQQAQNLLQFAKTIEKAVPMLNGLGSARNISQSIASLASLSTVMGRLKPPSASQITNLGNFALALRTLDFKNLSSSGNFFATLAAIGQFKAPSASQVKNLVNFATAVSQIKVPANGAAIATYLQQISAAAGAANGNVVRFRNSISQTSTVFPRFSAGAHSARLELMGLQNAFSGTFQVGSLLRSLLGSLTIGEVGRSFFEATQSMNQFKASMEVLGLAPAMQADTWTRVTQAANHFGADLTTYSDGFAKFAVAAHESGASLAESTKIYEAFQTVTTAMHLGTEQQQSVGLALREGMDRGYVSTQILTRQLGLVLPGALATAQKAWKEANGQQADIFDAMKKRTVDSIWLFDKLADHYIQAYGPALTQALESPVQQFNILKNNIKQFMQQVAEAGAQKGFADLLKKISSYLNPTDLKHYATIIGNDLAKALDKAGRMVDWFAQNWGKIKGPLGTTLKLLSEWMVVTATYDIGKHLVQPLFSGVTAARTLWPELMKVGTAIKAINSANLFGGLATAFATPMATLGTLQTMFARLVGVGPAILSIGPKIAAGLTAPLTGVIATAGLVAGAIVTGVAGGFAMAVNVGRQAGVQMQHDQYSTWEIIKGGFLLVGDFIVGVWKKVTGFLGSAAQWIGDKIGIPFAGAADFISKAFFSIYYVFSKVGALILDTAKGIGLGISDYMVSKIGGLMKIGKGDFAGAYADLGKSVGESLSTGFSKGFKGFKFSAADMQAQMRNVGIGADYLLTAMGKRGRGTPETGLHKGDAPTTKDLWKSAMGDASNRDSHYGGSNGAGGGAAGGKKKKGPKDHELSDLKTAESGIDSMMAKLSQGDPSDKIAAKFTDDVTKIGQALFKKKDIYKNFIDGLGKSDGTPQGEIDVLTKAIRNGGVDPKVLADLHKRFHLTGTELIEKLNQFAEDAEQKVREGIIKDAGEKYKKQNDAYAKVADKDPLKKLDLESTTKLQDEAATFLPKTKQGEADFKAYLDTLQNVKTGTVDVQAATDILSAKVRAQGGIYVQVADTIDQYGRAQAYARQEAALASKFGAKLLQQKEQELLLTGQSADDQRILTELQSEVQARKKEGLPISQKEIDDLRTKLELNDKLLQKEKMRVDWIANNGVKAYVNGVQQAGAAINDLDKNFLQSVEDQLVSLGKTGKFSFDTIFSTIQDGLLKFSAGQIVKSITGAFMNTTGETPTIFGKLFKGAYTAPTPLPDGKSSTELSVSAQSGNFVTDPKTEVLFTETARDLSTKFQTQNQEIASNFQTALSSTFQPLAASFETSLRSAISAAGGRTSGRRRVAGQMTANDNNPMDLWNTATIGPDRIAQGGSVLFGKSTSSVTDKLVQTATARTATSFSSTMTNMMPLVGLAFAGAFKSPIGQIAAMFGTLLIQRLFTSASSGGGSGIGGILGSLFKVGMSFVPGGGTTAGIVAGLNGAAKANIAANPGIFKEGGLITMPVARSTVSAALFTNAPHYKEGTANTSGGHPAILHDNEAVIPLSRGREVPVELRGVGGKGGGGDSTINMPNVNVNVHNYGDGKAKVEHSQNPDGSMNLDVIVERIESNMASNIRKGGSPLNQAIEHRYSVSAAAGNY